MCVDCVVCVCECVLFLKIVLFDCTKVRWVNEIYVQFDLSHLTNQLIKTRTNSQFFHLVLSVYQTTFSILFTSNLQVDSTCQYI